MKIHTKFGGNRHLRTRFLGAKKIPTKPTVPQIPDEVVEVPVTKALFAQEEKQIVALASINMRNQKITNLRSGSEDSDAVNNSAMKIYVSNAMRAPNGPVNDRDIINKGFFDSKLLHLESKINSSIDLKSDEERVTKLERSYVSDYGRHDEKLQQMEGKITQLETNKSSVLNTFEQQLKLLKNIMVLRQITVYSTLTGQFTNGVFFKDAKITSVMINNLKQSKLTAIYTQMNGVNVNTIRRELKLKGKSTTEYDFVLDTGNENRFVTFETSPPVGDTSITIFYEQKSPSTPSQ
jgi:hypothetical protein